MHACESCGAKLTAFADKCPYCDAITRYGANQAQSHARFAAAAEMQANQYRAQQDARKQSDLDLQLRTMASHSATWAGVGLVLCCVPIPSTVGIVLGFRAKRVARERGVVAPSSSTIGIVLGFAGYVLMVAGYGFYYWDTQETEAKRKVLQEQLKDVADQEELELDTACKVASLHFLDAKYDGGRVMEVACDGATVAQNSDKAEVPGIVLTVKSNPIKVTLCMHRGKKWVVDEAVARETCAPLASATSASTSTPTTSASTSATPTASASAPK